MNLPDVRQTVSWSIIALAGGGAWVSYLHTYSAARAAGQPSACAVVYPVLTDVLVLSATVCLLHASQNKRNATVPRWAFGLGVAATLFANVLYGARYGPLSAIVSGWPAVAFVTGVVLAHWLVSAAVERLATADQEEEKPAPTGNLPVKVPSPRPEEPASAGNLPVRGKTDLVRAAFAAAHEKGRNPTPAELVRELLEQGHKVSGTLARNVAREALNGATRNGNRS